MENFVVKIDLSSVYGEGHELERALLDLFNKNPLLPTREGTVIDVRVEQLDIEPMLDKDENEVFSRVKDEPVKIKRITGSDQ